MKKLLASMIAGLMMAGGLALVAGTSAHAAPYPGTIQTVTKPTVKKSSVKPGAKVKVKIKVSAVGGGGVPKGIVKIRIVKQGKKIKFKADHPLVKGKTSITTPALTKKGVYRIKAKFVPTAGSVFKGSRAVVRVTVS